MNRTLLHGIMLLGLGALVLGLMAVYVTLFQYRPEANEALKITPSRTIVWPGQDVALHVDLSLAKEDQDRSIPERVLFLIDISPSMSDQDVIAAKSAVVQFRRSLGFDDARTLEVGLIEFGDDARLVMPMSGDFAELGERIRRVGTSRFSGTAFVPPLRLALDQLEGRGPAVVILLTDGECEERPETLRAFYESAWAPSGHSLHMIGVGEGGGATHLFRQLTPDPQDPYAFVVTDLAQAGISGLFEQTLQQLITLFGRQTTLHLPLATPIWAPGEAGDGADAFSQRPALLALDGPGREYSLPMLFAGGEYRWQIPLEPKIGGILPILRGLPGVRYVDAAGDPQRLRPAERPSPTVLVVTWLLLLLLALPALLYLLIALLDWLMRRQVPIPPLNPVSWRRPHRPPPPLPVRFLPDAQRIRWAPTLLLGLGGSGRAILTQVQQNIADSFDRPQDRPVLLALDVARDELRQGLGEPAPGCLGTLVAQQVFMLPPESCSLTDAVHRRFPSDHPARALDLTPYTNLGGDALTLRSGTKGEAPLARLALLMDLENGAGSALLTRLGAALDEWRGIAPENRARQILLVANADGGVGRGWLTDLLILLRRLVATDEQAGQAVEIIVLLIGEDHPKRDRELPLSCPTLCAELDRLAAAGARPFRHRLAEHPGDAGDVLDGWVTRRPQDTLFVLPGPAGADRALSLYPTAADALTLLLDQSRRTALTYQLQAVAGEEVRLRAADGRERYTRIEIHNAIFPRAFFRALLIQRLKNLLGRHQVLFPELADDGAAMHPLTAEAAALLDGSVDEELAPVAAALRLAAQGQCGGLDEVALEPELLRQGCQVMKNLLLVNANDLLREGKLGLAGLARACTGLADAWRLCGSRLGSDNPLLDLAATCDALRLQALTWIELFFGSATVVALGTDAPLGKQGGRMRDWSQALEATLSQLWQWNVSPSRKLVAPMAAEDLRNPQAAEAKQEALLRRLLAHWLERDTDADDIVTELRQRCSWELIAPGNGGEPAGITMVLRATQTRRYEPSAEALDRFDTDLAEELGPVIDQSADFHILALLSQQLPEAADANTFVDQLKGQLKGETSTLLVTLPEALPTHAERVKSMRAALHDTFDRRTRGPAEDVRLLDVTDRNRISILQAVPLLVAAADTVAHPQALHRSERLLTQYGHRLAQHLQVNRPSLPPAAAIALDDPPRLRHFAALHRNGQVVKRDLDQLWSVTDGARWHRLTALPEQQLADAAAYFVTHDLDVPLTPRPFGEAAPLDTRDDFGALLEWLLETQEPTPQGVQEPSGHA